MWNVRNNDKLNRVRDVTSVWILHNPRRRHECRYGRRLGIHPSTQPETLLILMLCISVDIICLWILLIKSNQVQNTNKWFMDVFQLCNGLKFILCPHTEWGKIDQRKSQKLTQIHDISVCCAVWLTLWRRRYDIYKAAHQRVGWWNYNKWTW